MGILAGKRILVTGGQLYLWNANGLTRQRYKTCLSVPMP
jgi:hypothetical protein